MRTFSELAQEIPVDSPTAKLAAKLANDFSREFNRRLQEVKDGRALGLYRPWDDRDAA